MSSVQQSPPKQESWRQLSAPCGVVLRPFLCDIPVTGAARLREIFTALIWHERGRVRETRLGSPSHGLRRRGVSDFGRCPSCLFPLIPARDLAAYCRKKPGNLISAYEAQKGQKAAAHL